MKKVWKRPELEVLDVSMTMNGPGNANPDCYDVGHPVPGNQSPLTSNASCLPKGGNGGGFDS